MIGTTFFSAANFFRAPSDRPGIFPDHPVMIQPHGAIPRVESARGCIPGFDIHAHSKGSLLDKPVRHPHQQLAGDPASASLWSDIDPLQFTVATVPAGSMSRHKSGHLIVIHRNENCASRQGLLRRLFDRHVRANPPLPVSLGLPFPCTNRRHSG